MHDYWIKFRRTFFPRKLPKPIFVVSMPQSGSAFVRSTLAISLGIRFDAADVGPLLRGFVDRRRLQECIRRDTSYFKSHVSADPYNIDALSQSGVTRVCVHLRDPRDSLLSWLHKSNNQFILGDHPSMNELAASGYAIRRDWSTLTRDYQQQWLVEHYFPELCLWSKKWLDTIRSGSDGMEYMLTSFELMSRTPKSYIESLSKFYSLDLNVEEIRFPELKKGSFANNFRSGKSGGYKEELSDYQIDICNKVMSDLDIASHFTSNNHD